MAETKKLALTKPSEFPYDNGNKTGYEFRSIEGETFNCFDAKLVRAFLAADLAGKEAEYEVRPPKAGKANAKPSIVGIIGVYKADYQGGKGGGGPTNRQSALASAALVGAARGLTTRETVLLATIYEKFLETGEVPAARSAGGGENPPPHQTRASVPTDAQIPAARRVQTVEAPILNGETTVPERVEKLKVEALKTWPNDPKLALRWLDSFAMGGVIHGSKEWFDAGLGELKLIREGAEVVGDG